MARNDGDDRSGGGTGRRPASALIALCCLVGILLLFTALPSIATPLSGGGEDAMADGGEDTLVGEDEDALGEAAEAGPIGETLATLAESLGLHHLFEGAGMDIDPGGELGSGVTAPEETRIDGNAEYAGANEQVHFTVEADRPAYWRTTAYDVYDGDGWVRSSDADRLEGIPMAGERETLTHEVTFERPSSVVPAAWRPVSADVSSGDRVRYGPENGMHLDGTAEPGETVVVESELPVTDPDVLAGAGTDYPAEIEDRYTALPDDVPTRVHDRTAAITADADGPYETATTVETWLRANHDYSLDVPPPEGNVADEVLFERDEAYCAYFASTMTVMLRSEGIPARYAVGYNSGERVGDDEYVVRGMHAHAWVEVYFPEVGWVPFEPTPASDRADELEAAADESAGAEEFDAGDRDDDPTVEPGDDMEGEGDVPRDEPEDGQADDEEDEPEDEDEQADDEGDEPEDEQTDEEDEQADEQPPLEIDLEDDPVPGEELTVTVTRGDEPVVGAEVTFNDESIGMTDGAGQVTGTVPYADELEIRVASESTTRSPSSSLGASDGHSATRSTYAVGAGVATTDTAVAASGGNRSVDLPALDLEIDGEPVVGETVTAVVTVEGTPVEGATVSVDGEPVGETDDEGAADVSLPPAETATVVVQRGELERERTLEIAEMSVSLEGDPVALPHRSATVIATADDDPVDGVPVYLDGERVGETDGNGTADVSLPAALSTTAAVGEDGELGSTTARPLVNALGGVALLSLGAVALAKTARGRDMGRLASLPVVASRRLLTAIVRVSQRADLLLSAAIDGLKRALTGIDAARAVLRETGTRLFEAVRGVLSRLRSLPTLLSLSALLSLVRRGDGSTAGSDGGATSRASDGASDGLERTAADAVREAWYRLVGALSLSRPETRTPAEIADRAIDAGLPADAVERILEAFRSVEYGDRTPESPAVERVRDAADRVDEEGDR